MNNYDTIVIGSGAAGMISAIYSAKNGRKTLILEKLPKLGTKLKATGGGKCNLTNTLSNYDFMSSFGKNGKFMRDALSVFNHNDLIAFFSDIGVKTHSPDGFRVFPITHNSQTILTALIDELINQKVQTKCSCEVVDLLSEHNKIIGVKTKEEEFSCKNIIIATGGLGYPTLGATGDGYNFAKNVGHSITELSPAMMPLHVKESWVELCRADTIAKVVIKIDMKKHKSLKAKGDLIFTKNGIRGPVVLDFAREITPLLSKYGEVPILCNLTKGMNEEDIRSFFKKLSKEDISILEILKKLLPEQLSIQLCDMSSIELTNRVSKIANQKKISLSNF